MGAPQAAGRCWANCSANACPQRIRLAVMHPLFAANPIVHGVFCGNLQRRKARQKVEGYREALAKEGRAVESKLEGFFDEEASTKASCTANLKTIYTFGEILVVIDGNSCDFAPTLREMLP